MAKTYRSRLVALHEGLLREKTKPEASEVIRQLGVRVILVPENGELGILLKGDLANMLNFAANNKFDTDAVSIAAHLVPGIGCGSLQSAILAAHSMPYSIDYFVIGRSWMDLMAHDRLCNAEVAI